MALLLSIISCTLFLLQLLSAASATALTTAIAANERVCFYADVDKAGEKLGVCTLQAYGVC